MASDKIRARNLVLRCYANKDGDQWQVFCIDLCLAAQGNSFLEARNKLGNMLTEYVYDALAGEDREFADQLLNRKAPFNQIATYHWYKWMHRIGIFRDGIHRLFKQPMPLVPLAHAHE